MTRASSLSKISDREDNGITVFMPIPPVMTPYKSIGIPEPEFYSDKFVYDALRMCMHLEST